MAWGFFVDCDSGCVNGTRVLASYLTAGGGLGLGSPISVELGEWHLEDGQGSPDGKNLEGPFSYHGCSITLFVGGSVAEVNQGKGHGRFSPTGTGLFGAGCFVITGGSKMVHEEVGCCVVGSTPIIRATP